MSKLQRSLEILGVEAGAAGVYEYLLLNGGFQVGRLSKLLGVPRTTLYTQLAKLLELSLVRESVRKGVKTYVAESPDSITRLFARRQGIIQEQSKVFSELLPELRNKSRLTSSAPRLSIFEGKTGLENVLNDMLMYADLETCSVWPIAKMIRTLSPEFFKYHNKERIRRNIYTRAVWPVKEAVSVADFPFLGWGPEFKREIRLAPSQMSYALGYWIYSNKVAFLSSIEEGYGFIIQSQELVDTLMAQFEMLWSASVQLKFDKRDAKKFIDEIEN